MMGEMAAVRVGLTATCLGVAALVASACTDPGTCREAMEKITVYETTQVHWTPGSLDAYIGTIENGIAHGPKGHRTCREADGRLQPLRDHLVRLRQPPPAPKPTEAAMRPRVLPGGEGWTQHHKWLITERHTLQGTGSAARRLGTAHTGLITMDQAQRLLVSNVKTDASGQPQQMDVLVEKFRFVVDVGFFKKQMGQELEGKHLKLSRSGRRWSVSPVGFHATNDAKDSLGSFQLLWLASIYPEGLVKPGDRWAAHPEGVPNLLGWQGKPAELTLNKNESAFAYDEDGAFRVSGVLDAMERVEGATHTATVASTTVYGANGGPPQSWKLHGRIKGTMGIIAGMQLVLDGETDSVGSAEPVP